MKLLVLLILLILVGFAGTAYAEETFSGHSSIDPPISEITPRKTTAVNVLFQYTTGPYAITDLFPQVEITPQSAKEYVTIDVVPIELNRGDLRRIPIMITVDQDIPNEKIFLSISFSGKHFLTGSTFTSSWFESVTLDVVSDEIESAEHKVPEPEPKCPEGTILKDNACIEADSTCGNGTTYQDGVCLVDESNTNSGNWTTSYPKIIKPPLKQWKQGASPVDINCSKDKFLMINPDNEKPACLFVSSSMIRFAQNGWIPVRNLALESPTVNTISGDGGEFAKRYFSYFEIKDNNSITVHDINDKSLVSTVHSGDKIISDCIDAGGSSEITVSTLVQINAKDNSISMTKQKQTWPSGFCEDDDSILSKYYSRFFTRDVAVSKPEPEPEPGPIPEAEQLQRQMRLTALNEVETILQTDYRGNEIKINAIKEYTDKFESGYFMKQFLFALDDQYKKDAMINFTFTEWGYQNQECTSPLLKMYLKPYDNYTAFGSIKKIYEWQNPNYCDSLESYSDGYLILNFWRMPDFPEQYRTCTVPGKYKIFASSIEGENPHSVGSFTCQREMLQEESQPWMELPD